MKIGCIGQGFVGKNTADNFEMRGYDVIRYALEPEYKNNAELLRDCEIVFVAVPTPTTPNGFDSSVVKSVIELTAKGTVVVIKSTILPGTTRRIQDEYSDKIVLFSPEFLSEKTAEYDVTNPIVNVIGCVSETEECRQAANRVMSILPKSEHNFIVSAEAAELFKYAHNLNGYFRVILANLLYEVGDKMSVDWTEIKPMMDSDIMMSPFYNDPIHKGGRGAGGNCFIKDMAAFRQLYGAVVAEDTDGFALLTAMEKKNLALLHATEKNQDLVKVVYGL